jgi:hypothetical protein
VGARPRGSAAAARTFYVLEGTYTFYTGTAPAEGVGPGTFVFIDFSAIWSGTVLHVLVAEIHI